MKNHLFVSGGLGVAVLATVAAVMIARPSAAEPDATLIRPEIKIEAAGKMLKIRGAFRVLRPIGTGRDHAVVIRLTVSEPGNGKALHSEDLAKIDYRRDHPRDVTYRVDRDVDVPAEGKAVKVAALDIADGRELASVVQGE